MRSVMTRARAALLLLLLLVASPLIAVWPNQAAQVRLAGLSLLWWYDGVLAPVLAALIAIAWLPDRAPSSTTE
jgi:hypothetical protein